MPTIDETGNRHGNVTVVKRAGSRDNKVMWECLCKCGNTFVTRGSSLRAGKTQSCGCAGSAGYKHGGFGTVEYGAWSAMKARCYCKANAAYHYYGGRGIVVCDRWRHNFENFLEDMGKRPDGMSLDRIDNDGPYSPENCRWATKSEQSNNRRTNHLLTMNGETMTVSQWGRRLNIPKSRIHNRLRKGWSDFDALTKPVHSPEMRRTREKSL